MVQKFCRTHKPFINPFLSCFVFGLAVKILFKKAQPPFADGLTARAVINRILPPIYLVCFSPKTATQLTDSFVVASLPLASLAFASLLGQINCTD
jgi:hypothetical protein